MTRTKPDFALDLAPEGVNLWRHSRSGDWMGLGFVQKDTADFSKTIDSHRGTGRPTAELRIAKSDVYFTQIRSDLVPKDPSDAEILKVIENRIPFRNKAVPMIVDTCPRGSGDLAVAVVREETLQDAAEFAETHGFEPRYFTTLYNPMIFPAEPRFHLVPPPKPNHKLKSKPRAMPKPRLAMRHNRVLLAFVAASVLLLFGFALIRAVVTTTPAPATIATEQIAHGADIRIIPASAAEPEKPLPISAAIEPGRTGPTPTFAVEVLPPQALPSDLLDVTLEPDVADAVPAPATTASAKPAAAATETKEQPAQATASTLGSKSSEFEPSGLMKRTRRMLDNSFITIEEPKDGETGRKTIRILPVELEEGAMRSRFDPRSFIRVAQAQTTANDAAGGIPDVENDLLRITESGVPLFEGKPEAVPPSRPGTGTAEVEEVDADLRSFSDGITQVLDATDASGVEVKKPSLGTIRPRPNPFIAKASTPNAAPQSAYPVQAASAAKLRPRLRPDSLTRKAQNLKVEEALEQARQDAIRENMPTPNAVFVSLLPKPRPDNVAKLVQRTKPSLTSPPSGSNAVVRSAPQGAQRTGTMTIAKTKESVAELATESARLSKNSISLIGIFGTSSARRALLRLPSGRYIKVKQGDDVSGWNVSAIGESSVRVKRGSRDQVLRMPE